MNRTDMAKALEALSYLGDSYVDRRTTEEKIIDKVQWNFRGHLCDKCNMIYRFPDYETTQHPHPCPYAELEGYETSDNGMGYDVIKCNHYVPIDMRRLYKTWINSEEWKDWAYKKIKRAGYKCEICGSAKNLCVHHITYEHMLFEEEHMEDLLCVCKDCHKKLHENDLNKRAQENAVVKMLECKRQSM